MLVACATENHCKAYWVDPRVLLGLLLCLGIGCSEPEAEAFDSLYVGGDILTMAGGEPAYAEALGVEDGMIVFVGAASEARQREGPDTRVVDLAGATLLPGFVDAHSHLYQTAMKLATVPLDSPPAGSITSIADIQAALRAELEAHPRAPDEWLVGFGYELVEERTSPLSLIRPWISLPSAVLGAAWVNRSRSGGIVRYVAQRLRALF